MTQQETPVEHTLTESGTAGPGELVSFMVGRSDDRRASNVRWSVNGEQFRTGSYPELSWELYDHHPSQDTTEHVKPEHLFKVVKDLGHGSFAKVSLVELKLTGERLAIKIMDKKECPRFLRTKELRAFIQIGLSPFIVRYHSCFQTDVACCLLMQYHCGGSLAKIIEDYGILSEATTRFFAAEIVEGLLHLHRRHIIHRDIKLANILLGVDNHIRICDLGLCKLGIVGLAKTHTRCGALRYCAPEVLAREWYGKEVDWWSLGVVLFRLMTGQALTVFGAWKYPFDAGTREEVEDLIKNGMPNLGLLPEGPATNIIRNFLTKDPSKRLGNGLTPESEIHKQLFFQEINWDELQGRIAKPPSLLKRFMRNGSIFRCLAFGADVPNVGRVRRPVRRIGHFLASFLVVLIIFFAVLAYLQPPLRDKLQRALSPGYLACREKKIEA